MWRIPRGRVKLKRERVMNQRRWNGFWCEFNWGDSHSNRENGGGRKEKVCSIRRPSGFLGARMCLALCIWRTMKTATRCKLFEFLQRFNKDNMEDIYIIGTFLYFFSFDERFINLYSITTDSFYWMLYLIIDWICTLIIYFNISSNIPMYFIFKSSLLNLLTYL